MTSSKKATLPTAQTHGNAEKKMLKSAIAIFVKTPGKTALKTRLAKGIGRQNADDFYKLSYTAVGDVVDNFCQLGEFDIRPYWAVAEENSVDDPIWSTDQNLDSTFSTVWQGSGGMGERLDTVYRELKKNHGQVIILGSDCPQISRESLYRAVDILRTQDGFVVGDSLDGGFWLFGGTSKVPSRLWNEVTYSSESTSRELCLRLKALGNLKKIDRYQDVDEKIDLKKLRSELLSQPFLQPSQSNVLKWVESLQAD